MEIPERIKAEIPGAKPIYFTPADFYDINNYLRLLKGSPYLKPRDFKDESMFKRYFLIATDLLEGTVMVHGKERSGKSLWAYHLAYQRRELFGIPAVFNRKPKKGFGAYETLPDDELKAELDKFNQLVKEIEALDVDDDEPLPIDLDARMKALKFYGKTFVIDESYKEVAKDHITNRTRAYAQLIRQFGHLHSLFIFISPDANDIAGRLISERQTHDIACRYESGKCYYIVTINSPKVRGLIKTMELVPKNWSFLWNSFNLVGTENLRFHN